MYVCVKGSVLAAACCTCMCYATVGRRAPSFHATQIGMRELDGAPNAIGGGSGGCRSCAAGAHADCLFCSLNICAPVLCGGYMMLLLVSLPGMRAWIWRENITERCCAFVRPVICVRIEMDMRGAMVFGRIFLLVFCVEFAIYCHHSEANVIGRVIT